MKAIKKQLKRAFTIVELVIVIAVVAALAAILIPTFVNVVNSANLSSDTTNVHNFNTALATKVDPPANMNEVAAILEENGYNMPVEPVTSGYKYVWDSENNKIYMVDSSTLEVYYPENTTATNTDSWYDFKTRAIIGNSTYATYESATTTYTVSSVSGLYYVAEGINDGTISSSANITLGDDLTFTSEYSYPIVSYSGTFDGDNKTISGLTISGDTSFDNDYYSFIQYLKGGTIKDVKFEEVSINAGAGESGNCSVAALIGCIYEDSVISGVTVSGEITGVCRASGLVGVASYVDANGTFTIENCVNNATVTSLGGDTSSNKYAQAGGFISQVWTNVSPIVKNCTNNGNVTAYLGVNSGTTLAGGIIANDASLAGVYQSCTNTGTIYSEGDAAGGIIGMNSKNGSSAVSVTSCKNEGAITAKYSGGIVGSSQRVTFSNCTNSGAVTGTNSVAGGIVGSMYNAIASTITLNLSGCTNTATVTANTYAGGIVGETGNGNISISSCSGGTATITGGTVTVARQENNEGAGNVGRIAGKLSSEVNNGYSISVAIGTTNASDDNTIGMIGQIAGGTVNITSGTLVGGVTIQNSGHKNYLVFSSGTGWDWKSLTSAQSETTYFKGDLGDSTHNYVNTWTKQT